MAIKGIFYVFAEVADLARSKNFYAETLGWKLNTDEKEVAGFAFGNAYLVLYGTGKKISAGSSMYVEVQVDDVNAEHARLKGLGVEVTDPVDQHWGERNFSFHDPDGHKWFYGQSLHGM
jgi:catechol 2,3-dioxygenase-like lactoylglutathione lyase family enzyme